jgi:hypothetical protein
MTIPKKWNAFGFYHYYLDYEEYLSDKFPMVELE